MISGLNFGGGVQSAGCPCTGSPVCQCGSQCGCPGGFGQGFKPYGI